ncbi:MAG: radical SAM protein, partial [Candidatus Eisenbacteria bacterium]|nr:radical SAM protein [Candidatus Eisenbacteria bacterium]
MPRYFLETYGCQMNLADSELLSGILGAHGWEPVPEPGQADLIVVNTCAVRERAAQRVIGHLRSYRPLRARKPGLRIAMVGCLARYAGRRLAEQLPEVDLFVGPDAYRRLPELLEDSAAPPRLAIGMQREETYADLQPRRAAGVRAWVSVMRGCDRFCSYCVVPLARGRERSLPLGSVLRAVARAVASGHPAVTLLGQTVTS